jgi:hypothetical protein
VYGQAKVASQNSSCAKNAKDIGREKEKRDKKDKNGKAEKKDDGKSRKRILGWSTRDGRSCGGRHEFLLGFILVFCL